MVGSLSLSLFLRRHHLYFLGVISTIPPLPSPSLDGKGLPG